VGQYELLRRARALERRHVPLTRPFDVVNAALSGQPLPPSPPGGVRGGYRWTPPIRDGSPEARNDAVARAILRAMVRFAKAQRAGVTPPVSPEIRAMVDRIVAGRKPPLAP